MNDKDQLGVSNQEITDAISADTPEEISKQYDALGVSPQQITSLVQEVVGDRPKIEGVEPQIIEEPETQPFSGVLELEGAAVESKDRDINRGKEIRELEKTHKVDRDTAEGMYLDPEFAEHQKSENNRDLGDLYPDLVVWASDKDNYKLLESDPEGLKDLSDKVNDWSTTLKLAGQTSKRVYHQSMSIMNYTYLTMANPEDKEKYFKAIEEHTKGVQDNPMVIAPAQAQRVTESFGKATTKAYSILDAAAKTIAFNEDEYQAIKNGDYQSLTADKITIDQEQIAQPMIDSIKKTSGSLQQFHDTLGVFLNNKKGVIAVTASSMESNALPELSGLMARLAATATPVPGKFAQASTAMVVQFFNAYGIHVRETVERAIQKGYVKDHREFFASPKRVEAMRKKATAYAVVQSGIQLGETLLAGSMISKSASKVKDAQGAWNKIKSVGKVAGAVGKEVGLQTASEGGSEFAANVASVAVSGDEKLDATAEEIFKLTAEETVFGLGSGVGRIAANLSMDSVSHLYSTTSKGIKHRRLMSTYKKLGDALEAKRNREAVAQQAEAYKKSIAKGYEGQAGELIDGTADNPDITANIISEDIETDQANFDTSEENLLESVIDAELDQIGTNRNKPRVTFNTDELRQFYEEEGVTVEEGIAEFGEDFVADYQKAAADGREVSMPLEVLLKNAGDEPRLLDLMRVNGNEQNSVQADYMIGGLEKEMESIFNDEEYDVLSQRRKKTKAEQEEDAYQSVPEEERVQEIEPEDEPIEGDVVLRQIKLTQKTRNKEDKDVLSAIEHQVRQAVTGLHGIKKGEEDQVVSFFSEMQFRHVRARAEVTNRSISEVQRTLRIRQETQAELNRRVEAERNSSGTVLGYLASKVSGLQDMTLVLNRHADVTTLTHELGHAWLHDLTHDWEVMHNMDKEKMNPRQREYLQAMDNAAEVLGLDSLSELLPMQRAKSNSAAYKKYRKIHETWAQTSERFFLDGKFDNNRVAQIFHTMKKWMKRMVGAFTAGQAYADEGIFPLPIDPKIESIFNAILDVSDNIEEAVHEVFPAPQFHPMDLGDKGSEYMETFQAVREEVIAHEVYQQMKPSMRENERKWEAAAKDAYKEATKSIDELYSMKVLRWFQKLDASNRIVRKDFIEAFGKDALSKMPPKVVAGAKKKGQSLQDILDVLEIKDPNMFLDIMKEAAKREELILDEQQRILEAKVIPQMSEEEIFNNAVDAVAEKGRSKLVKLEFKMLMDQYKSTFKGITGKLMSVTAFTNRASKGAIKARATSIVHNSPLAGFKSSRFFKSANTHRNDARTHWKRGDLEAALDSKLKEEEHNAAYIYARKIERSLAKNILIMKRVASTRLDKIARYYETSIYKKAQDIVLAFNSGQPLPIIDPRELTEMSVSEATVWAEQINAQLESIEFSLAKGQRGNPDVGTVFALGQVINAIRKRSRGHKVANLQAEAHMVEFVTNAMVQDIDMAAGSDAPKKGEGEKELFGTSYTWDIRKLEEEFQSYFKDDLAYSESFFSQLMNMVKIGEAKRLEAYTEARDSIRSKVDALSGKLRAEDSFLKKALEPIYNVAKRTPFIHNKFKPKKIYSTQLKHSFNSVEEVMVFIANMGSESNIEKVLMGGFGDGPLSSFDDTFSRIDDRGAWEFIQELVDNGTITEEHLNLIQGIWDVYAKTYPKIKKAMKSVKGYEIGYVEPKPFTLTINGKKKEFRGGYFPITASALEREMRNTLGDEEVVDLGALEGLFPKINLGLAKTRTNSYFPISLSMDASFNGSLKNIMQIAYLMEPMAEFAKIFNNKNLKARLEQRSPGIYKRMIRPWFDRVTSQEYTAQKERGAFMSASDYLMRHLRSNVRHAYYLGSVKTGLTQHLGLIQAATKLPISRMASNHAEVIVNSEKIRNDISKVSPRMRARFGHSQELMVHSLDNISLNSDWSTKLKERGDHYTFAIIQYNQNLVDMSVWKTAYEIAREEGKSEGVAIRFADQTVDTTQSSAAISSRSNFEHDTDVGKAFKDFTTIPLMLAHQNLMVWRRSVDEETYQRVVKQAAVLSSTVVFPALIATAASTFYGSITGADEEEKRRKGGKVEDSWTSKFTLRLRREGLDMALPFWGRQVSSLMEGRVPQLSSSIQTATTSIGGSGDFFSTQKTFKQWRRTLDAATIVTGSVIPAALSQALEYTEDFFLDPEAVARHDREVLRNRRRDKERREREQRRNR